MTIVVYLVGHKMEILSYIIPSLSALGLLIAYIGFRDRRRKEKVDAYLEIKSEINEIEIKLAVLENNLDAHKEFAELHSNEMKLVINKLNQLLKELSG